jgi:pyridoxal phosphate enzyme (YggS family)
VETTDFNREIPMTQDNIQSTDNEIRKSLASVQIRIRTACNRFNRDPTQISLLAVSKTKPISMIESALRLGQTDFGENYLQDALEKIAAFKDQENLSSLTHKPIWHYIGAIQSNKTRPIAEHFDWVHTVSSSKVARRLSDQRPSNLAPLKIMLQVNIDNEPTKFGIKPEELHELISVIAPLPGVSLRGLMAIPAPSTTLESQRLPFQALRELKEDCRSHFPNELKCFDHLSMGMTGDLDAAVAEGTTWLRIGTAIFGARN